jgi:Transposase IS66 family
LDLAGYAIPPTPTGLAPPQGAFLSIQTLQAEINAIDQEIAQIENSEAQAVVKKLLNHDGRHYKKLKPFVPIHQRTLTEFRSRYWAYYTELLKYQREPTPEKKANLAQQFDEIFSATTGYEDLDDRIAKTLTKKTALLRVLELPQLPLHNNAAELGARVQARVRDVSFQTRSEQGTKIKDTFLTINQTAKKLGVSFYD